MRNIPVDYRLHAFITLLHARILLMFVCVHALFAGLELLEKQSRQEDISCLPSLKVTDISSEVEKVHLTSSMEGEERILL